MRVFVTGATGFIGFAIVNELLSAGHQVTGLARSAASGKKLTDAGARVVVGSIEDRDCLRRAAAAADGAIHTAFYHKLSHIGLGKRLGLFLGGAPGGIVQRFMTAAVDTDRRALETIGRSLAGTDRPLVAAFATMAMKEGQLASEDQPFDPDFFAAPRAETEHLLQRLAADGVRTSAIRLPPSVHGKGDQASSPCSSTWPGKRTHRVTSVTVRTAGLPCTASMPRACFALRWRAEKKAARITASPKKASPSGTSPSSSDNA
jgi:nucleoside-diphosphate-sugar epimerase